MSTEGKDTPATGAPSMDPAAAPPPNVAATPRATRRLRSAASQHIVAQRVEFVLAHYVNGYTGTRLVQKVAAAHAKEAGARQLHAEAEAAGNPTTKLPPLIWGPEDQPPSERTVYNWLTKAKLELEQRGSQVYRLGDRLMGLQLARLDVAWQQSLKHKRPATLVRVVEATNKLFAFEGAIRPALTALQATPEHAGEAEPLPDASLTEDSAVLVLSDLLSKAKRRQAAAITTTSTTSEATG